MYRGSTVKCTIVITNATELVNYKQLWITFADLRNNVLINKDISQITIEGNKIIFTLSQTDTLTLLPRNAEDAEVQIQIRGLTLQGQTTVSPIQRTTVQRILKDGVIE